MRNKVQRKFKGSLLSLLGLIIFIACNLFPQKILPTHDAITPLSAATQNQLLITPQTFTSSPPTNTPNNQLADFISSENASEYIGEIVIVRIEKAYCSYRPDVNGAPTFCNDRPFPNHTFTLITWGKDWSDLDNKCLYVEGEIEEYEGKFEIIADSRDQISYCD